jgi:MoaA/NifB/PqqE/SkfB family radical SAM enzyme
MPWEMIQILWNGQITLCCFDSMEGFFNMGNVRDVNVSDYWRYDKGLSRIRKMHLAGDFSDIKVCGNCNEDQYETRAFFSSTTAQSAEPANQVDW